MSIVTECSDGIMVLTLDRADKRNALTRAMYARLADALLRADADSAIRVVLLRGAGDHFCAGNDIPDFIAANAGGGTGDVADSPVGRFLLTLNRLAVPLVAAVKGHAVGIGATLLLHADLVLVADDARLSMPFVNLALCPEAASSLLLPERIGHARAFAMMALGEVISGTEAALGLANQVSASAEVDDLAMAAARALAARPPGALAATKALMRRTDRVEAVMRAEFDAFAARLATPEAAEAFAAFIDRRPPDFSRF